MVVTEVADAPFPNPTVVPKLKCPAAPVGVAAVIVAVVTAIAAGVTEPSAGGAPNVLATKAVVAIFVLLSPTVCVVAVELPSAKELENVGVPVNEGLPLKIGDPVKVPAKTPLVMDGAAIAGEAASTRAPVPV